MLAAGQLLDFSKLMPVAIFGVIAAVAWVVMDFFGGASKKRSEDRLAEIKDPLARRRPDAMKAKKSDAMSRMLEKAAPMAQPLQPKTEKEAGLLKGRLSAAGFRGEKAVTIFLGLKFIGLLVGLALGGGGILLTSGINQNALMGTVACGGLSFYLPDMVVWFISRGRKSNIFFGLPDALDLMVVCVEAGLGLDQAMRKVSDEMKRSCKVICEEFHLCNMQLQMGKARVEVLHDLGSRTGVDDLRALAAILVQADKFGSSIAQALRVQSDAMRTRRRQMAEEKAAKTAVKLIFPMVLFIFPGIFVVLVGPAAITMVREMFPAMAGGT